MPFPVTCTLCGATVQVPSRVHQARAMYCSRKCFGAAFSARKKAEAEQRPRAIEACKRCGDSFVVTWGKRVFCSRRCASLYQVERIAEATKGKPRADKAKAAKIRIDRSRTFVNQLNARTVCAHCGAQPVEWHNPEHVEKERENFRIGRMANTGASIQKIQAEVERCTPLCRRCHMIEDGRMAKFIEAGIPNRRPANYQRGVCSHAVAARLVATPKRGESA